MKKKNNNNRKIKGNTDEKNNISNGYRLRSFELRCEAIYYT